MSHVLIIQKKSGNTADIIQVVEYGESMFI